MPNTKKELNEIKISKEQDPWSVRKGKIQEALNRIVQTQRDLTVEDLEIVKRELTIMFNHAYQYGKEIGQRSPPALNQPKT